ncbi:MAG: Rpn family recombination-promoting nuclease/putative transposase [Romboutsia sp.]
MKTSLLSPKIDFVFKKIFGSQEHPKVLISFLNAVLKPIIAIVEVEIKNSDIEKEYIEDKFSRLDIKAKTNKKHMIYIEIQVKNEYNMIKRSLYYWGKLYTNQFKNKGKYKELERTVCINILEAWLQFIKEPEKNLELDIKEIKEAKDELCKLSSNEKERKMYFIREQSLIQKESALDCAKEEGKIKGQMEKAVEIANNLLSMGLSIEQIQVEVD